MGKAVRSRWRTVLLDGTVPSALELGGFWWFRSRSCKKKLVLTFLLGTLAFITFAYHVSYCGGIGSQRASRANGGCRELMAGVIKPAMPRTGGIHRRASTGGVNRRASTGGVYWRCRLSASKGGVDRRASTGGVDRRGGVVAASKGGVHRPVSTGMSRPAAS